VIKIQLLAKLTSRTGTNPEISEETHMKKRYFEGLLAAGRDCIAYGEGMDFAAGLIGRAENDYQRGERFALRTFRDHEESDAVDLITARLWKWGAQEELDRFLAFVGMDPDGEPVPVQDRPALRDKIANLRLLDRNGCATVTDGGLDDLSDAEVAAIIDEAIASIRRDHEAPLPPIVAYEKLSGEVVLDYGEGGAR
jgi:hypothetical protein